MTDLVSEVFGKKDTAKSGRVNLKVQGKKDADKGKGRLRTRRVAGATSATDAAEPKKRSRKGKAAAAPKKEGKASRKTARAANADAAAKPAKKVRGAKSAKGNTDTGVSYTLADALNTEKLARPGKLNGADRKSVTTHFAYQLSAALDKVTSERAISGIIVGAIKDAFEVKHSSDALKALSNELGRKIRAAHRKDATMALKNLLAEMGDEGVDAASIQDAVAEAVAAE